MSTIYNDAFAHFYICPSYLLRPLRLNATRIAPTPSGYLHLGNALSFAVTAALAEKYKASVLLRIDDLDQDRVRAEYVHDIFDTLNFLGIKWDRGPRNYEDYQNIFSQQHRLGLYSDLLDELKSSGHLFACNCTRRQLEGGKYNGRCADKGLDFAAPDVSWRLDTRKIIPLALCDVDGNISTHYLPDSMRYFIVRQKNGLPAYQLSSVVDDLHFNVNLIVRGEDLFDSTLAQLYLAECVGLKRFWEARFYHHPLLKNSAGQKLSKSAGDISVKWFREKRETPQSLFHEISKLMNIEPGAGSPVELGTQILV